MYIQDVPELKTKLGQNGISPADIEFIMSQIKDSKLDEDFKMMRNNVYLLFSERNVWDAFEKSLNDLGIVLSHTNEPER